MSYSSDYWKLGSALILRLGNLPDIETFPVLFTVTDGWSYPQIEI